MARGRFELRTERNESSRQQAGRHQDGWTDDDLAYLRENFGTMNHVDIAAHLGRTVEACRQRFYSKATATPERSLSSKRTPGQRAWEKGVTSFGEDYW